jgi:hypothetical protein
MAALNNRIRDKGLNKLVHRLLKCGYVNTLNLVDSRLEMDKGMPQGSIISPLMSNIFFHRLDKFIIEEIISKAKLEEINYVRYADNFLIGLKSDKALAIELLSKVLYFCEATLKMDIYPDKTAIKHRSKGLIYLGYNIRYDSLTIPIESLYKMYADKGFFMKARKGNNKKYVARRLDKLVSKTPLEILGYYNSVMAGLIKYYKGSTDLVGFLYTLRRSAALTISHFYGKKSAK